MTLFKYSLFILLLVCTTAHSATIQKWVDDSGKVHYGERPPEHAKSQQLKGSISSISNDNKSNEAPVLYTAAWCGYCKQARAFLQNNNIAFDEQDIERSSTANRIYKSKGGKGIPFLVEGDQTMQGFNPKSYRRFFKIGTNTTDTNTDSDKTNLIQ